MTYEYLCTSCGYQWEAEQRISESPLRECPKCKKATAKRQVSGGTGFLLKGGGWYADGYGSKATTSSASEPAGASSGSSSSTSSSASDSSPSTETSAATSVSASDSKSAPSTSSGSKKAKASKPATS